jgi:site-specific recombinase XerD
VDGERFVLVHGLHRLEASRHWAKIRSSGTLSKPKGVRNLLRHSAGCALAGRGVDTRTLQAFMGHRSIANTVIYTAVADKRVRNVGRSDRHLAIGRRWVTHGGLIC